MQERTVLVLVVALVLSTAGAGVAVNLLRPNDATTWRAFTLDVGSVGNATVGSSMNVSVSVRQGMLDPASLWVVFLSLDVGSMTILTATPGSNPWGYPTTWNLTGLDLTRTQLFNVTVVPTDVGSTMLSAIIWVPRGGLNSAPIEANGHVNPAGVTLESVAQESILVSAVA